MIGITESLQTKRILTLSKLSALGFNDQNTTSKVLNGNMKTIKYVYNKYIKNKNILLQKEIKGLLDLKQFNSTNYKCNKCKKRHYLGSKVYYNHYKYSKLNYGYLEQQKEYLDQCLNTILDKHYNNDKFTVKFQELVDYTIEYLEKFTNTALNTDLRNYIENSYKTDIKDNYNDILMQENIRIQKNIKLLKEIIEHIEYLDYLSNDITKLERLRMQRDIEGYSIDYVKDIYDLINSNNDISIILNDLDLTKGKFNNRVLYAKIKQYIQDYKDMLYNLNFGINYYSNKKTNKNGKTYYQKVGCLPFDDSSKFQKDINLASNQSKLDLNLFYCWDRSDKFKNFKYWYNYMLQHPNIEILNHGINQKRKDQKLPSHYITYIYHTTNRINKIVRNMKYKIYKHIEIENSNNINDNGKLVNVDFSFDYDNKYNKINKYNKYLRSLGIREYLKYYEIFYPAYNNPKYLFSTFGHLMNPPSKIILDSLTKKAKKVKKVKMGNLKREQKSQYLMNKNLATILYYMSAKYNLRKEITYKNKENTKQFILMMINEANSHKLLYDNLHAYYNEYFDGIHAKITYINERIRKLDVKILKLKEIYEKMPNKRKKEARELKGKFQLLEKKHDSYLRIRKELVDKNSKILAFFGTLSMNNEVNQISDNVHDLMVKEIKTFYRKVLVRHVHTNRHQKEIINLALMNMNEQVLIKIIDDRKDIITSNDLFDRFLTYEGSVKQLNEYSNFDQCKEINVIAYLKIINKILKCFDNQSFVNEIIEMLFNVCLDFSNVECDMLNTK